MEEFQFIADLKSRVAGNVVKSVARVPTSGTIKSIFDLAIFSKNVLNSTTNFMLLWKTLRNQVCTRRVSSGVYGSVFRVCDEDQHCRSCVAIKFGLLLDSKGMVASKKGSAEELLALVEKGKLHMTGLNGDEIKTLKIMTEMVLDTRVTPHIVRYINSITDLSVGSLLFMEYVAPTQGLSTLYDLTSAKKVQDIFMMEDEDFRALLFQIVYTIAALQATFPGFRHNDLKTDNIALTAWDGGDHTYELYDSNRKLSFTLPKQKLLCKIIDMGLAHAPGSPFIRNKHVETAIGKQGRSQFFEFGVVPVICPVYDLHFLFSLILTHLAYHEHKTAKLAEPLKRLVNDCFPTWMFGEPYQNEHFRLTYEGQLLVQERMHEVRTPVQMLQHSYFDVFRTESNEDLEKTPTAKVSFPEFSVSVNERI